MEGKKASFVEGKRVRRTLYMVMRVMEHVLNECADCYACIRFIHKRKLNYNSDWAPDAGATRGRERQLRSANGKDYHFLSLLNSKLNDVLVVESLERCKTFHCYFSLTQPCVFKCITIEVTSRNHLVELAVVHGLKWTVEFDTWLRIPMEVPWSAPGVRSASIRSNYD